MKEAKEKSSGLLRAAQEGDPDAFGDQKAKDGVKQRRLANAWATGHHGYLRAEHQLQRLPLRGRQGLACAALDPWDRFVDVDLRPRKWTRRSFHQPRRNGLL